MISVNRLERRKSGFETVGPWILDSGAFTRITSGKGHLPADLYAAMCERWSENGEMVAAVQQDWMCEPVALKATGLTVSEHQRMSSERYEQLCELAPDVPWMPVVQGWHPHEYAAHARQLAKIVPTGAWVGVGSVCKRQSHPRVLRDVLAAILEEGDWRLHGFGVKVTALRWGPVVELMYSVDSMAWSWEARYRRWFDGWGRTQHDPMACVEWLRRIEAIEPIDQLLLPI